MPRHSGDILDRQSIAHIVSYFLKVHYTRVVIILTGEQCLGEVSRVDICKRMAVCIPTTKTKVKASNCSIFIVYNNNLLVVRPQLNAIYLMFNWKM